MLTKAASVVDGCLMRPRADEVATEIRLRIERSDLGSRPETRVHAPCTKAYANRAKPGAEGLDQA